MSLVVAGLLSLRSLIRSRGALQLEILALRHQLQVLERSRRPRLRLTAADRLLWVWFSRIWTQWPAGARPRATSHGDCVAVPTSNSVHVASIEATAVLQ